MRKCAIERKGNGLFLATASERYFMPSKRPEENDGNTTRPEGFLRLLLFKLSCVAISAFSLGVSWIVMDEVFGVAIGGGNRSCYWFPTLLGCVEVWHSWEISSVWLLLSILSLCYFLVSTATQAIQIQTEAKSKH